MNEYKVGELYRGKGEHVGQDIEITAESYGWFTLYNHATDSAFTCRQLMDKHLGKRTHDEHGNPVKVEVEPDPPEDKLYPVVIDEVGAWVGMHGSKHSFAVGEAIGRCDREGRICIGFQYADKCRDSQPIRWAYGEFAVYAIFRHHTLINQQE